LANDPQKSSLLDQLTDSATQPSPGIPGPLAGAASEDPATSVPGPLSLAAAPASTPGSTANLESIAASPDTLAANVAATKQSAENEKDANPGFLKKLGRIASGAVGLEDPNSSPEAGIGAKIGQLVGRTGAGLALAAGTPEQKQLAEEQLQTPLKMAQIQNEQQYRNALIGTKNDANDVKQQQADQQRQQAEGKMRLKGYMPDEKSPGAFRPMNEDEILGDPLLSKNQDLASAATASKNAGAALALARRDALLNPNNPALELKRQQIENTYKLAQASLGMRMHAQARQDDEHLFNYGQAVGQTTNQTGAAPGAPGQAQARPGGLSLENAPDMMVVNPATGLPIPNKMLSALKPTMTEQNRADFAASAIHSADKIKQLVDQAKAQIGPFDGRVAELMARAGLGDQFNQELQNYIRFTQSAATAAHTGRFSVPILDKMDKMIGPEMNPDQLAGAIDSVKGQMAPYADAGWKPTVWEYRSWLGGTGSTPSGKKAPQNGVLTPRTTVQDSATPPSGKRDSLGIR
jgi:hypothetical protein